MSTNPKYGPNITGAPNMSITKVRSDRKAEDVMASPSDRGPITMVSLKNKQLG